MSTLITDKVDNAAVQKEKLDTSAYLPHTPWLQFLLVCCLFALWGMAGNLNDILIAQFKKGFDLTDTQTALVQSIFFLGYFFVALPAAALIKRFSYKAAIIIGLCLYALGCFLFVPAAQIMTYGAFLACLGVIACGLSFLETSANTYSSLLGPIQSSTQRINFSQIFNSLGVISGVLIGQLMVFGENDPSHEQLLAMPAAAADVARHQMVGQVVGPYLIIGSVLVVLALVFVFIKFPSCKGAPAQQQQLPTESMGPTLKRLFAIPRFRLGILSQFLYVGAQVGVWSFTIRFVQLVQQGTSEHSATYWLLASLVIYAVGKTVATWLMNRLNPAMLLGTFALAATALLLIAVFSGSMLALVFVFIKFPSCKGAPAQQQQLPTESMGPTLKRLFAIPRFRLGILSQFLYVGAQVGVWSFTIRFVQLVQQGTSEHSATYWLLASLVIYAVGKTVATWLMNRLNPAMLLGTFALAATALLLIAVFSGSMLAVYALILVSFCMAPCWPTNFGLVIKGMGKDTQTAGSIVVMSIIGGAVIPLVMGIISDMNGGNMQIAFIAPLLCFVYVAFYGFWCVRKGV
ncbi:L-fucose:H+ symporter permease [Klebsiella pneumoniae]